MQGRLHLPQAYHEILSPRETERAILKIKDAFQTNLAYELNLTRVTAPLFVETGTGVNDDLNGVERPVTFEMPGVDNRRAEIVQSLAKWKRLVLADLGFRPGEGLYTDMNAIRPDEVPDSTHSLYVDQWDWEAVVNPQDRSVEYLVETAERVYDIVRRTERYICHEYEDLSPSLPARMTVVHSQELLDAYPTLTPREREREAVREHGAIFVVGIGGRLSDGSIHDGRAPDYDDWVTQTAPGRRGLNGDIVVLNPVLDDAFELSSMGVRVVPETLRRQLELCGATERMGLDFHRRLMSGELPASIGGGIGQSRLCMLYLKKAHIGEIQASIWPAEMRSACGQHGINLL